MQNSGLTSVLLLSTLTWLIFKIMWFGRRERTLPPGPPTIPILGNIHLLPLKYVFLRFTEWSKQYGGIFSLKVANATIIVVSDMNMVKELLDDRPNETSSRPFSYALDVVSGGNFFALASSADHIWIMGRKSIQPFLAPKAIQAHIPSIDLETTQLLYDVLHTPTNAYSHIFRYTFSSMTMLVFGKRIPTHDSPEATKFTEYIRHFMKAVSPETAPVDVMLILRHMPKIFAPWRKLWRVARHHQRSLYFSFLEHTERSVDSGNYNGNMMESVLDQQERLALSREQVAYIGGVTVDAGTETTSTLIQSLLLCLTQNPLCLKRAQSEIDNYVGDQRLPILSDINALPYVQALIKENHRLRTAVPTGVPHATSNDTQYRGYTIPKGAAVMINVWGILHDPDLFERPDEFWPERYLLTPDGTKPSLDKDYNIRGSLPFGSGKRLYPGMNYANTSLNLAVMRLLWAFDIAPEDSSSEKPVKWKISEEYSEGISLAPKNFRLKITPRSKDKGDVIENSYRALAES